MRVPAIVALSFALAFAPFSIPAIAAPAQPPPDPFADDERVAQKVSVTTEGLAVGDLLARIAEKTGVALAATTETRDDKVIVFGPARPLREVLADLAALFNDRWERKEGKDGVVRYTLTRTIRARQQEAELVQQRLERQEARLQEGVRALRETPAVFNRRPKDDLIRRLLADPDNRLGFAFYGLLSPRQRQTLFTRRRLMIPFEALTAAQKAPARQIIARRLVEHQKTVAKLKEEGFESANPSVAEMERGVLQFRISPGGVCQLWLTRPGYGTSLAMLADWDMSWTLPAHGNPYNREPVPADASLPDAEKTRAATAEPLWPDRLRRLATATGISVMSDLYRSSPVTPAPADGRTSPGRQVVALDELCRAPGYLWWTRGKTLLLRKRDWFLQNQREVPDGWALALAERLKAHGGRPTRGDLLTLRELTTAQIAGLASHCERWASDEIELLGLPELLAMMADSPTGQETALHAGMLTPTVLPRITLARSQLTPRQRAQIPAFLTAAEPVLSAEEVRDFRIMTYCSRDVPETSERGVRYWQVMVQYHLNGTGWSGDGGSYRLLLPMSLPDDRREKTSIEVGER
jgi:hypothetical protein